ncbi:SIT4 phosphatase-associated protein-domain-containing protein [Limtongia smithiae]|uniref:SIT4 phosphatase-associated protein-domain-containing protein n=1 Tax=Limtongia smithiae TaxID=1125753 RepID=UPI0034CEF801
MAFWRVSANFASHNAISGVNKLLEKSDCSLQDLLEEDDLLQELREHNAHLIEFLRKPEILRQMLCYIANIDIADKSSRKSSTSSASSSSQSESGMEEEAVAVPPPPADTSTTASGGSPSTGSDQLSLSDDDMKEPSEDVAQEDLGRDEDLDRDIEEDLGLTRIAASPEVEPTGSFDNEKAWRYAKLSAEVFASEIWSIYETVMRETELLDEFWTFLDKPAPLDPVYAGYFTKTNEQLLERKSEQMIKFLKTQPNLVTRFMRHIDTPSIIDLLLKILCTDKMDNPTGIIEYFQSLKLIPSLIGFLSSETPSNTQSAAGDFLKALITISANASNDFTSIGPNELTRELVSPEIMIQLADQMVASGGNALATAVGVIIELIRKNNSDYDTIPMMSMDLESNPPLPRDPVYLGYLLKILSQNIPRFQQLLTKPRDVRLLTSFGDIEPLGFERFKICELVAELLHCSNMGLLNDPQGESVAMERDALRKQARAAQQENEGSNFSTNGDTPSGYGRSDNGINDIDSSLNDLSVGESMSPSESRGWWGLGKKKASLPSPQNIIRSSTPTIEETAEPDELEEEGEKVGHDETMEDESEPIKEEHEHVAAPSEDATKVPELTESELPTEANAPDVAATADAPEESNMDDFIENENDLVVGDFLKYQLIKYRVVTTIIEHFFRFPWNNFLHNVVFDIIQQIFNGPFDRGYNRYLAIELFKTDHICDQIIEGTKKSAEYEAETRMRLGYMGHLTLISEEIVKFRQRYPPQSLSPAIVENTVNNENWMHYVNETLMEIRIKDNSILGGPRPSSEMSHHSHLLLTMGDQGNDMGDDDDGEIAAEYSNDHMNMDSRDDEDDGDDDDSGGRLGLGQNNDQWSRYMSQQMTPDRFGSSDEDDEDEDVQEADDKVDMNQSRSPPDDDDYADDDLGGGLARTSSHEL